MELTHSLKKMRLEVRIKLEVFWEYGIRVWAFQSDDEIK